MLQRCLKILCNLLSQHFWIGQVLTVFQRVILEPEDVEVGFVAFDDLVVGEATPASVGFFVLGPVGASFGS